MILFAIYTLIDSQAINDYVYALELSQSLSLSFKRFLCFLLEKLHAKSVLFI